MKITKNIIKEINIQIKESLEEWSEALSDADCDGWAVDLLFDEKDLLNALKMFTSIWANSAIRRGVITEDNCVEKLRKLKTTVGEIFGADIEKLNKVGWDNNNNEELN